MSRAHFDRALYPVNPRMDGVDRGPRPAHMVYLTEEEVASLLGLSIREVQKMALRGDLRRDIARGGFQKSAVLVLREAMQAEAVAETGTWGRLMRETPRPR